MSKNSIFTGIKLVAILLCLAVCCGCGGGTTDDPKRVYRDPSLPKDKDVSDLKSIDGQVDVDFNDTDIGRQIRQDYLKAVIDSCGLAEYPCEDLAIADFWTRVYYGTYNDSIVVTMGGKDPCSIFPCPTVMLSSHMIADIMFVFRNYYPKDEIIVWHEGKFHPLWQAYDNGWVTQKDLQEISEYHQWVFYSDHPSGDYSKGNGFLSE